MGVRFINHEAFRRCHVDIVHIPYTVEDIGEKAFYLSSVKEVIFDDIEKSQLKIIHRAAFNTCYLSGIILPDSVETIGDYVFDHTYLKNVKLNKGLQKIGKNSFSYTESPFSIIIPSSVDYIGPDAFRASGLTDITFEKRDTPLDIGPSAFELSKLVSIKLPEGLNELTDDIFSLSSYLKEVYIPHSVQDISSYAFDECFSLKDIYYNGTKEEWEECLVRALEKIKNPKDNTICTYTIHCTDGDILEG